MRAEVESEKGEGRNGSEPNYLTILRKISGDFHIIAHKILQLHKYPSTIHLNRGPCGRAFTLSKPILNTVFSIKRVLNEKFKRFIYAKRGV